MRLPRPVAAFVIVAAASAASGCAMTNTTYPTAATTTAVAPYSWIVQATGSHLTARDSPNGRVIARLASPNVFGDALTALAIAQDGDWLQVELPVRPNGSTGWVPESSVRLMWTPYRIGVSIARHTLVLYNRGRAVFHTRAGVGARSTPTPRGTFYLTTLLKQPRRDGPYGPYAFGLSAFSPVLKHFAGGPGEIGLHGTNDPSSVGHSVTHGCIRVANSVITMLAKRIPLGTPIDVTA
jgi:lipoprotein-anchoring transpeptidase ErfK/SrfK